MTALNFETQVSPMLDPVTAHKFQILGSNYLTHLETIIDEDNLPGAQICA
jgi:hypothetical protein